MSSMNSTSFTSLAAGAALVLGLAAACSSDPEPTPPSTSTTFDAGVGVETGVESPTTTSSTTISGTINGKSFTAKSGFGFRNKGGTVDIILSDQADACASIEKAKLHAGETMVQLYRLAGTAPGAFGETDDVKYVTVKPTCTSGQPLGDADVASSSRATTTKVDLTALDAASVEGTLTVTFEDGSTVSGPFDFPMCSVTVPELTTCF